jgi:hypothetical protein
MTEQTNQTEPGTGPAAEPTPRQETTPAAAEAGPEAAPNGAQKGGPKRGGKSAKKGGARGGKGKAARKPQAAEPVDTPAPAASGQAPRRKDGLRAAQVRILALLAGTKGGLTKPEIARQAEVHPNWVFDMAGRLDLAAEPGAWQTTASAKGLAAEARHGFPSLLTLGLVRGAVREAEGRREATYGITPSGRKALARAQGEAKP